jgi:hypothetical protein
MRVEPCASTSWPTPFSQRSGEFKEDGDRRFIKMARKFVDIDDLHIDLIDRVQPFRS